jgi:cell wall-associated NlpC family hydrolase
MGKLVTALAAALAMVVTGVVLVATVVLGQLSAPTLSGGSASALSGSPVPPEWLTLYEQASTICPGLSWSVLAAIGTVETDNGQSNAPGVHSGANSAGAEGPMQFEPATFAEYDTPVPPGGVNPPDVYDPVDSVYAAVRDLCANGGRNGANLNAAVFAYNHSDTYVAEVLALAHTYGQAQAQTVPAVPSGSTGGVALAWALAQVGTPYIWGGETPGVGFDCSGLVQAAYKVAGITLPRVAQDQYDAGPHLPPGTPLEPGDLVFFGASSTAIGHVGLVVAPGTMVDAPHSGAEVRQEPFPVTLGSAWGGDLYIGATRPGA